MALIEELDKQGQFLFRWRSYLPAVFLFLSFFFLPYYQYPNQNYEHHLYYLLFCLFVSLFGLALRGIVIGYSPENTSGRNTKKQVADSINKTGIYSLIRHPLYLGNFFLHGGIALIPRSSILLILFFFLHWFYYERIMFTEEQYLRNKFGQKYISWAAHTPALIPNFQNFKKPETSFSFKTVIRKEYSSFLGILIIFVLLDILISYCINGFNFENGHNLFSDFQKSIFLFSIGTYIALRIIVKKTSWLKLDGR